MKSVQKFIKQVCDKSALPKRLSMADLNYRCPHPVLLSRSEGGSLAPAGLNCIIFG